MHLTRQKAADIEVGDQLFYRFHRYDVHEVVAQGSYVRVVGTGERGALYVVLAAHRMLWSLKRQEKRDPLHGLRGWRVPVQRRPALPGVPGHRHLPVLPRDHVAGEIAQHAALVGPGVRAVRALIGSRVPRPVLWAPQAQKVPYLFSVDGRSLVAALHTGWRRGFGVDGGAEALGEGSMVPDLRTPLPPVGGSALGCDRSTARTIRIVIPSSPQERDDQGIPAG
jgi:hypothetical protein